MNGALIKVALIGTPFAGALLLGLFGGRHLKVQRRAAVLTLVVTGLVALLLFLSQGYAACALLTGAENCMEEGLSTLLLLAGSVALAWRYWSPGPTIAADESARYILALLLIGALAGVLIADNLFLWLVAWYILSYAIYRSLQRKGLRWGFLVLRDDYKDDAGTH